MQKQKHQTPFREFVKKDENHRYHIRLAATIYSTDLKFQNICYEKDGVRTSVDSQTLKRKDWILRNLKQEVEFQRRKELAVILDKTCFQRNKRYSANQRIAYNNAKFNRGS